MGFSDSIGGIGDAVGNLDPSNIGAIFSNPVFAKIGFFVKMFIYMIVVVGVCIFLYKTIVQYKIKITLLTRIGGGGVEVKADRAKIVVDKQNKRKLQLLKLRRGRHPITLPIPDSYYKSKVKKTDHYFLWIDDNFQCHPMENMKGKKKKLGLKDLADTIFKRGDDHKPFAAGQFIKPMKSPVLKEKDEHLLAIRPEERDAWARMEDTLILERYQKKDRLEKYLPSAILLMSMIVGFLIVFFGFKTLGAGLSGLTQEFAKVAQQCLMLGG